MHEHERHGYLIFRAIVDPEDAPDSGQPLHVWEEVGGVETEEEANESVSEESSGVYAIVAADDFKIVEPCPPQT